MDSIQPRHFCPYEECSKAFSDLKNLRKHVKAIHREPDNYKCQVCSKHLASRQALREHSYLHTGERPYVCRHPGCQMSFRQGSQLSVHKRTHREPRRSSTLDVRLMQLLPLLNRDGLFLLEPEVPRLDEDTLARVDLPLISEDHQVMRGLPNYFNR